MLTTFMGALAVLALLFVMMGVKIVRQGHRYTIEHFGRFVRVADPGFNYVVPFFYRVGRKINMESGTPVSLAMAANSCPA